MLTSLTRVCPAVLLGLGLSAYPALAQTISSYTKAAAYDDVKFELTNAIIKRGLVVDHTGQLGKMLERTAADVGSTKPLYRQAEFVTFCSAKFSRAMMEAELNNIAFCPFVVFIYEAISKPGEIVVGYRRPAPTGDNEASKKALAEIDALLDGIVRDAVQ